MLESLTATRNKVLGFAAAVYENGFHAGVACRLHFYLKQRSTSVCNCSAVSVTRVITVGPPTSSLVLSALLHETSHYLLSTCQHRHLGLVYTVWVKPPWNFLTFFPKRLGIFSPNFTRLLFYKCIKFVLNLQLWRSYAILSATTMWSKCPPSTETHAGWPHVIWHNFVTVGENWIKICF